MSTKKIQILDNLGFVSHKEQVLTEEQQTQARTNIGLFDNCVILTDNVNGYKYAVQMINGNLVSDMLCSGINITTLPTKTEYYEGESFDPEGMVVTAEYPDGRSVEITNYTYSEISEEYIVTVTYKQAIEFTTTIQLTPKVFDPAITLADFEYDTNDDGTYTITAWNGTLNGVESTEIIVPNVNLVRV